MSAALQRISKICQVLAGMANPLGMFALLAVGVHVGTDRLDDLLFDLLSAIDGIADVIAVGAIRTMGGLLSFEPETVDRWTFAVAELVDVELKTTSSRYGALLIEIVSDALLAIPIFMQGGGAIKLRAVVETLFFALRDPNILRLALPISVLASGLAGAFAVAREVETALHAQLVEIDWLSDRAPVMAPICGALALLLVITRVLPRVLARCIDYAHQRSLAQRKSIQQKGLFGPRAALRYRLFGWRSALMTGPVSLLAFGATSFLGALRAIWPG